MGVMDQKITPTLENPEAETEVNITDSGTNKSEITWGKDTPSILDVMDQKITSTLQRKT